MMCRWDKETYDAAQKDRTEHEEVFKSDYKMKPTKERGSIAEQAKELLKGKETWKQTPKKDEWEDGGEEVEVEKDVQLPKAER